MRRYGSRTIVLGGMLGAILCWLLVAATPALALEQALLNSNDIAVFYEECMDMKVAFASLGRGLPVWLNLTSVTLDRAAPPRCSQPEVGGETQLSALLESETRRIVQTRFLMSPQDVQGSMLLEMRPGEASAAPMVFKLTFEARDGESFYGFDSGNNVQSMRGSRVSVPGLESNFQNRSSVVTPLILSSRGYGLFIAGGETVAFDMDSKSQGTWSLEVNSARLRIYFLAGPDPVQALERYNRISGKPPIDLDLNLFIQ